MAPGIERNWRWKNTFNCIRGLFCLVGIMQKICCRNHYRGVEETWWECWPVYKLSDKAYRKPCSTPQREVLAFILFKNEPYTAGRKKWPLRGGWMGAECRYSFCSRVSVHELTCGHCSVRKTVRSHDPCDLLSPNLVCLGEKERPVRYQNF